MKTLYFSFVVVLGALSITHCTNNSSSSKDVSLDSDEAKFSYALGYEMGSSMKRQNVSIDSDVFRAALMDAMGGQTERLSSEERRKIMKEASQRKREERKAQSQKNLKGGQDFLEANKKKEGVQVTSSGLQYKVTQPGQGVRPTAEDTVEVHYKGTLIDGTVFDSSEGKKPFQFSLTSVIPGWTEGLQLMKVGSKYTLYVPPNLGYGPRGNPKIPGNSVLIFEIELLDINPDKKEKKAEAGKEATPSDKKKGQARSQDDHSGHNHPAPDRDNTAPKTPGERTEKKVEK